MIILTFSCQSYYQGYQGNPYYGYDPSQQVQGYTYDASTQQAQAAAAAAQGYGYAQPTWQQPQQQPTQTSQTPPAKRFNKPAKAPRDTVSIHCDICEINCLGQDAYNAHMVGRKHATAAKRKVIFCVFFPSHLIYFFLFVSMCFSTFFNF